MFCDTVINFGNRKASPILYTCEMENFSMILAELEQSLEADVVSECFYTHNNIKLKNIGKKPLNEIHLERIVNVKVKEPPPDLDIDKLSPKELSKYYEKKKEVIPALHKSWIPDHLMLYEYQPYFTTNPEDNKSFIPNNKKYVEMLMYLLNCSFHEFWCTILLKPACVKALMSYLMHPIPPYELGHLPEDCAAVYETVYSYFFWVYERLFSFRCSEEEYLTESFGRKCLLENRLISLPIVITLYLLYKDQNRTFVNRIATFYFTDETQEKFIEKEVEERINHTKLVLEIIEALVCRTDDGPDAIPISLDPRPYSFSLPWVCSVVDYLLHTAATLNALFDVHGPAVDRAIAQELPSRLCHTYEAVYGELYEMLDERADLHEQPQLAELVLDGIAAGRTAMLDAYNAFVSLCLDRTLASQQAPAVQEEQVETYLRLMTAALENECFVCDYHVKYPVDVTNEMFAGYCTIDATRTDYIMKCIDNLPRVHKLSEIIKQRKTIEDSFRNHVPPVQQEAPSTSKQEVNGISKQEGLTEYELNEMICDIMDMFPHLGDGFIEKCLEVYNYKTTEVINAILEENLPPHLLDMPFDMVRIPPEPEPPKPLLEYRGKRPDYNDAIKLLDDKKAKQEMKTYVLEGIKYGTDYDPYDDEYDDRADDAPVPIYMPDNGADEISRYNPNYQPEDLASDTSYSEEEYDEEGKPVAAACQGDTRDRRNFCEDPAVIRARREAQYRGRGGGRGGGGRGGGGRGGSSNVVGKPKGQGQDKNTVRSRQVKSANKSSRANHNRKGGAQFKRSRGMF